MGVGGSSGKASGTGGNDAGAKDAGGSGATSDAGPGAPDVKITSPTAAADPNQDEVVVGDQATVLCSAKQSTAAGSLPVDAASVKLALLDASAAVVNEMPGTPTQNPDEYSASFVLTSIPNGKLSFRCTAADTSSTPQAGSDTVDTFVDHGPLITVSSPLKDSAYPLAGAVPFAFTVSALPLSADDMEAAVSSVTFSVNGVSIPPALDTQTPDGYKFSVDFNNTTLFRQTPSGSIPVVITAQDTRTPTAAQRSENYFFTLDGTGPVIVVTSPKDQDIIGGKVTLTFTVTDALTSVDPNTVSVELNQVVNLYGSGGQWTNNGDTYTFTFDSSNVAGSSVQVTVNITASDIAGNKAPGESLILYLDNQPPIVDLDAGNVRVSKMSGTTRYCSESFDPLGPLAANDLEVFALSFVHFRTLAWDQTNGVSGQTVFYYSTTDPNSVYLYLQPDGANVPLLINNDSDPECDALATAVSGAALPNLHLNPVTPQGLAWYTMDGYSVDPAIAPAPPDPLAPCILGSEIQPQLLCTSQASDMNVVIKHSMSGIEPVVYGIGSMTGLECTGSGWELPSQTPLEGWFCLAATATDKVGNVGISAPLRICFDNPTTGFVPPCANSSTTPPSCTDGCIPPGHFPPTIFLVP